MKNAFFLLGIIIFNMPCFGQNTTLLAKKLSKQQVDSIFTDSVISKFNLNLPIKKVYKYDDKLGTSLIVLTEKTTVKSDGILVKDSLEAFNFRYNNNHLTLFWSFIDFVKTERYIEPEDSIGFWTKYLSLEDYDNDGYIEPIIIYGTYGKSYCGESRLKILIYYKGKKRAVRNQNSEYDRFRFTQVDNSFYKLPKEIQDNVKETIKIMNENNHASFPPSWEKEMLNKKLKFDDSKMY